MKESDHTYTTREAAKYLGCSRQWVAQLRKNGQLQPVDQRTMDRKVRDRDGIAGDFARVGLKVRTLPESVQATPALPLPVEVGEDHELLIRDVALVLRCSDQRVRQLVKNRRLPARKPGVEYFIRVGALLDLNIEQSAGARPRFRFAQSDLDKLKGSGDGGKENGA